MGASSPSGLASGDLNLRGRGSRRRRRLFGRLILPGDREGQQQADKRRQPGAGRGTGQTSTAGFHLGPNVAHSPTAESIEPGLTGPSGKP